jgi:hypothetical protein
MLWQLKFEQLCFFLNSRKLKTDIVESIQEAFKKILREEVKVRWPLRVFSMRMCMCVCVCVRFPAVIQNLEGAIHLWCVNKRWDGGMKRKYRFSCYNPLLLFPSTRRKGRGTLEEKLFTIFRWKIYSPNQTGWRSLRLQILNFFQHI